MDRKELMPNGKLKGYMKKMLTNVLPQSILERPKSGFQVDAPTVVIAKIITSTKSKSTPKS